MIMNTKQFYEFEYSIRKSCEKIIPTDMRLIVCGKMLIEGVKSLHLEKTDDTCECIIQTNEYFPGNMGESSKYGYRGYVPDICRIDIEREELFKDRIIGYLNK